MAAAFKNVNKKIFMSSLTRRSRSFSAAMSLFFKGETADYTNNVMWIDVI